MPRSTVRQSMSKKPKQQAPHAIVCNLQMHAVAHKHTYTNAVQHTSTEHCDNSFVALHPLLERKFGSQANLVVIARQGNIQIEPVQEYVQIVPLCMLMHVTQPLLALIVGEFLYWLHSPP